MVVLYEWGDAMGVNRSIEIEIYIFTKPILERQSLFYVNAERYFVIYGRIVFYNWKL